jgi:hypothetical protein
MTLSSFRPRHAANRCTGTGGLEADHRRGREILIHGIGDVLLAGHLPHGCHFHHPAAAGIEQHVIAGSTVVVMARIPGPADSTDVNSADTADFLHHQIHQVSRPLLNSGLPPPFTWRCAPYSKLSIAIDMPRPWQWPSFGSKNFNGSSCCRSADRRTANQLVR